MISVKCPRHNHIIDQSGIRADPAKTEAIIKMSAPQNVAEVRRFVSMVNQLSKFIPNCADLLHPLTVLLSKKKVWVWGPSQEEAFTTLKDKLSKLTTLTLYNPAANIKLSADASSYVRDHGRKLPLTFLSLKVKLI